MATKLNNNNLTSPPRPTEDNFFTPPRTPLSPFFANRVSSNQSSSSSSIRKTLFSETPSPKLPTKLLKKRKESPIAQSPADLKVTKAARQSHVFANSASSASSAASVLPMPEQGVFKIEGQIRELSRKKQKKAPEAPRKKLASRFFINPEQEKSKAKLLNSYYNPSIIEDRNLSPLNTHDSEGQYKTPWIDPNDPNKLVLTFKNTSLNTSAVIIDKHIITSMKQYKQACEVFGEDKCVKIFNADTAKEDKYFEVERIPRSLKDALIDLKEGLNGFRFSSVEQLKGPLDENQKTALEFLKQIKDFFDLSIKYEIDTDLHIGNFRVKDGNLILTDFRESINEGDLIPNKTKEFTEFQRDLGEIFSPDFLNAYFEYPAERLNQE